MDRNETYSVLIVEDDPGEQKMLKMLFAQSSVKISITLCDNGEEAQILLQQTVESEQVSRFDLIILDLNLPRISGLQLLSFIKSDVALKKIPVVILTTSYNQSDINSAYENGASGYIMKPAVWEEYEKIVQSLINYWFSTCLL